MGQVQLKINQSRAIPFRSIARHLRTQCAEINRGWSWIYSLENKFHLIRKFSSFNCVEEGLGGMTLGGGLAI